MKPDLAYILSKKVEKYINDNEMIRHGDSVIIGLSGGADSVCLFLLLNKIKEKIGIDLQAVHINHGIRGESAKRDENFSYELCKQYLIPFTSYNVDIPKIAEKSGLTLEEAGRNARYSIFEEKAAEIINNGKDECSVKIAVAHHMNDQAETVIFNMIRGSGLKGMSGISPVNTRKTLILEDKTINSFAEISIIRPLLCLTKDEILNYLEFEGQKFCIDETNSDNSYSRNLIRNEVLNTLSEIQPKAVTHISNMAADAKEAYSFIEESVKNLYDNSVTDYESCLIKQETVKYTGLSINVSQVKDNNPFIVKQLILYTIGQIINTCKDITKKHIDDVYSLFSKGKGKIINLPYGLIAEKKKEAVVIYRNNEKNIRNEK